MLAWLFQGVAATCNACIAAATVPLYTCRSCKCVAVYIAAAKQKKPHHRVQKTQYMIVPMEMFQLNMSNVTRMALHRNSAGK